MKIIAIITHIMNTETIQSYLNTGLSYSTKAICYAAHGAKKIACAAPGFIASSAKEIMYAAPGVFADIVGPQIAGAGYTWALRPLAIGTHSLRWKKTNRPNAAFNAFSLPIGRAIMAVPQITQAVDAVANVTSKASDCVTDKIPREIVSEQAIQMLKQHTKGQFICYLEALIVYKLASAFFKVDKPEPSISTVINPVNLVWVGFACAVMRLLAYLSEDLELEQLPAPIPTKAPIVPKALQQTKSNPIVQPKKSLRDRCFSIKSKTPILV
jgi:hypothetical protein